MKIKVCKCCGMVIMASDHKNGKPACPICYPDKDSGVIVEVECPDILKCGACKVERKVEDILKEFTSIPFVKPSEGTYYCGCRGWD